MEHTTVLENEDRICKVLGVCDIPASYRKDGQNKARLVRATLEKLVNEVPTGKALVLEFDNKKEAHDMRSMFYTMSIIRFGEAGHISSRIVENLFYVWLVETSVAQTVDVK